MKSSLGRKAYIYARVSTAEQQKEGFSIQAQQKMLRTYAKKNGYTAHTGQRFHLAGPKIPAFSPEL